MFSVPTVLFVLRFYFGLRDRSRWWGWVLLTLMGLIVYEMHMASWVVLAIALVVFSLWRLQEQFRKFGGWRASDLVGAALPLVTLIPPLALSALFVTGSSYRYIRESHIPETILDRFKPMIALSFVRSLSDIDFVSAAVLGLLVAGFAARAVYRRGRTRTWTNASDAWLAVAIACAAASILAPSAMSGVFIRHRMALYAWMFLVTWLSTQRWNLRLDRLCFVALALIAGLPFVWRMAAYGKWSRAVDEVISVAPFVEDGSRVLALDMQQNWNRINPLLHAVDRWAPKPFIDLRNYEAATAYFPTQFRANRYPFNALGTLDELQRQPPVFHLAAYEQAERTTVDYLLFYSSHDDGQPEKEMYRDDLNGYRLIYVSAPQRIARLYQRVRMSGHPMF